MAECAFESSSFIPSVEEFDQMMDDALSSRTSRALYALAGEPSREQLRQQMAEFQPRYLFDEPTDYLRTVLFWRHFVATLDATTQTAIVELTNQVIAAAFADSFLPEPARRIIMLLNTLVAIYNKIIAGSEVPTHEYLNNLLIIIDNVRDGLSIPYPPMINIIIIIKQHIEQLATTQVSVDMATRELAIIADIIQQLPNTIRDMMAFNAEQRRARASRPSRVVATDGGVIVSQLPGMPELSDAELSDVLRAVGMLRPGEPAHRR